MRLSYFFKLCFVVLFLFSCNDRPLTTSDPIVKVGVLLPETGSGSSTGESIKAALEYFANSQSNEIRSKFRIQLVYKDTETNPAKCLQALKEFKSQNIEIIIGPYSSSELSEIQTYANQNNMLILSPSSVAVSLSIRNDKVFRFAPNDSAQALALSKYLESNSLKYLTGLYRNDVWGKDISRLVSNNHIYQGLYADNFYSYDITLSDVSISIDKLSEKLKSFKNSGADLNKFGLYFASFNEGTSILENIVESPLSGYNELKLIGSSAYANNSTLLTNEKAANYAISNELICPVFGVPESNKTTVKYVNIMNNLGREPESYAYVAYDIIDYISYLIQMTNYQSYRRLNFITDKIINESKNFNGITGNLELNDNGDRKFGNYDFVGIRKINNRYEWFTKAIYDYQQNKIIIK